MACGTSDILDARQAPLSLFIPWMIKANFGADYGNFIYFYVCKLVNAKFWSFFQKLVKAQVFK
jgi:hypothetical protein